MSAEISNPFNRIDKKFSVVNGERAKNLIIYITAGYPDIATTERLIIALDRSGADIIELGVPFSDPVADGPTIQESSRQALKHKINLAQIFRLVSRVRQKTVSALVLMSYYNSILQYGLERFASDCAKHGADGVIVPDLIPEEGGSLLKAAVKHGIKVIFLLAPTSDNARIKLVAEKSSGFIYCVTVTGITGARTALPDFKKYVARVRKFTDKPIAMGFGISGAKMLGRVLKYADGAIVGSAVIRKITENLGRKELVERTGRFVSGLAKGIPDYCRPSGKHKLNAKKT